MDSSPDSKSIKSVERLPKLSEGIRPSITLVLNISNFLEA